MINSTPAENTGSYEKTVERIFIKFKKSHLKMVESGGALSLSKCPVKVLPREVYNFGWEKNTSIFYWNHDDFA